MKKILIKALRDTVLKRFPVDSTTLAVEQKQAIAKGTEIYALSYAIADKHVSFISIEDSYLGEWYAFGGHVEVFEDGKLITSDLINLEQLTYIAVNTSGDRIAQLLPNLNLAMQRYQINTPLRIAHFLAQCAHESDGFNTNREYASGADYEGRADLGNTQEGDGVKYVGRGLIQVTGFYNYKDCGDALGIDLISSPERLEDFDLACLSAGWFWDKNNLNAIADQDDIYRITRIVNGGENGMSDRIYYLDLAKEAIA